MLAIAVALAETLLPAIALLALALAVGQSGTLAASAASLRPSSYHIGRRLHRAVGVAAPTPFAHVHWRRFGGHDHSISHPHFHLLDSVLELGLVVDIFD